ncbi:MAG: DsbA family protein [Terriglobales bacterium]
MRKRAGLLALFLFASGAAARQAPAQGITRQQADTIIDELHSIHQLLLRLVPGPGAAALNRPPALVSVRLRPDTHSSGSASAPAAIVEFTDLQCPNCREFAASTFPALRARYIATGKLRFFNLDLPLPVHRYAHQAAVAENCAGEQGQFWQFRRALLLSHGPPSPAVLSETGSALKLDTRELAACESSRKYDAELAQNRAKAIAAGITGTPGFVVGAFAAGVLTGVRILGAQPLSDFVAAINGALATSHAKPPAH